MGSPIRTQVDGKWLWFTIDDYGFEISQSRRVVEFFTKGGFACMRVLEVYADPSKPPTLVHEICRNVKVAAKQLFGAYAERL